MKLINAIGLALALAGSGAAGCDSLFDISNPGPIADDALNDPAAFSGLVVGVSGDFSQALDAIGYISATISGELRSTGQTPAFLAIGQGTVVPSDANSYWNNGQRARWVAEDAIRRIEAAGHQSALLARAYLLAGYANRLLGENFCAAVFDGGPEEPFTNYFERARAHFTTAGELAESSREQTLLTASRAGLASVTAALGRWDEAAALAELVPLSFRYDAVFSLNSSRETSNALIYYPLEHSEGTVWGTEWAQVGDIRTPWEVALDAGGAPRLGRDSRTPFYRALKYRTRGDEVALSKGTEMALIRAEAALRRGNVEGLLAGINLARGRHGLPPIATVEPGAEWDLLKYERGAELWLEGRRFWDRRRWFAEGRDNYIANHNDKCFPIGQSERDSNANLKS